MYILGVSVYKLNRSPVCTQVRSPWAIKKILKVKSNEKLRNRLRNEAKILKKLNHPNIIGFRALTKDNRGEVCLALEACTISLGDLIETRSEEGLAAFPAYNIALVIRDIAKAFNYLHNKAYILHCDVKSYNILIQGKFAICKLCDFDIALPLNPDGTVSPEFISENVPLGTGPWMAPETCLHSIVSTKSDIYSYGLVIWEMVALTVPPLPEDENSSYTELPELNASNSSIDGLKCIDWRPELPAQEFTEDYDQVLEVFYCCTEKNPEYRPNATLLEEVGEEILQT